MDIVMSNIFKSEIDEAERDEISISDETILRRIKDGTIKFKANYDYLDVIIGKRSFHLDDESDEDGYGWNEFLEDSKDNPELLIEKVADYLEYCGRQSYYSDRYDDWCYFKNVLEYGD